MVAPLDARHIASQNGNFAPQHASMFTLEISGLDGDAKDLIVLSLSSFKLPKDENEVWTIPYGNEERKGAGKAKIDAMPLVVNDWVDRAIRKACVDWRKQVYDPATGAVGLPANYKKQAEIILSASDGTRQRKCRLVGLWPSDLEGGELKMEGSDLVKISMTLQCDLFDWEGL